MPEKTGAISDAPASCRETAVPGNLERVKDPPPTRVRIGALDPYRSVEYL